jgi:hypothetical protein
MSERGLLTCYAAYTLLVVLGWCVVIVIVAPWMLG